MPNKIDFGVDRAPHFPLVLLADETRVAYKEDGTVIFTGFEPDEASRKIFEEAVPTIIPYLPTRATPGAALITIERSRQITEEGWTPEHDDEHDDGQMALAAACFASPILLFERNDRFANQTVYQDPFPWDSCWDKRYTYDGGNVIQAPETRNTKDRIDLLTKAGALIAAEIDRLQRAEIKLPETEVLQSILGLVFENPPEEDVISEWSDERKLEAEKWAGGVHLAASDNDIEVGATPEFLKQYK